MTMHAHHRGFTLIELMIALTIGLLIAFAATFLFLSSKQSFRTQEGLSEVQESGRNALRLLSTTLRYAGYLPDPITEIDPTIKLSGPNFIAIGGSDGVPPTYLVNANGSGIGNARSDTDSVFISYMGNADQSVRTCLGDSANNDPLGANSPPTLVKVGFYVTTANAANLGTLNCYTARVKNLATFLDGAGRPGTCTATSCAIRNEPVVSGVRDFQVTYGVDSNGDQVADRFFNGDDITTTAQWRSVVAIQLNVSLQSVDAVDALAGANTAGRIARNFSTTIAIRNRLTP